MARSLAGHVQAGPWPPVLIGSTRPVSLRLHPNSRGRTSPAARRISSCFLSVSSQPSFLEFSRMCHWMSESLAIWWNFQDPEGFQKSLSLPIFTKKRGNQYPLEKTTMCPEKLQGGGDSELNIFVSTYWATMLQRVVVRGRAFLKRKSFKENGFLFLCEKAKEAKSPVF